MDLVRRCPRCLEETKPFALHVKPGGLVILFYRCECQHKWKASQEEDLPVIEIGNRSIFTLRE